jgi:hypothetical protein
MQVDQDDEGKREAGRGQPRRPVVDAELLEGEHGAPVVERGFLKPGLAVEHRGDEVVTDEHFTRDLGVTWLIGPDQAEAGTAEDRHQPVKQQDGGERNEGPELEGGGRVPDMREPGRGAPHGAVFLAPNPFACGAALHVAVGLLGLTGRMGPL